jgi:hypothetical protein
MDKYAIVVVTAHLSFESDAVMEKDHSAVRILKLIYNSSCGRQKSDASFFHRIAKSQEKIVAMAGEVGETVWRCIIIMNHARTVGISCYYSEG